MVEDWVPVRDLFEEMLGEVSVEVGRAAALAPSRVEKRFLAPKSAEDL